MVPDIPARTNSGAEYDLFKIIRDELSNDWIALHSLGLTIHPGKPWAELDFVLIGPPGVICLEVKGGEISREEGVWYTTPLRGAKKGIRERLKESPFHQVGKGSAELYTYLERKLSFVRESIVGYAVATPDSHWTVAGPDVERALVYDAKDCESPIGTYLDRVAGYWSGRLGRNWHRDLELLGRAEKHAVLELLRGDFNLVPSLRAEGEAATRELVRLTQEQCEMFTRLAKAGNPRIVVKGGAGTGKTLIATGEATRLSALGKNVLFTCMSRNLANHVQSLIGDLPGVTVRTLHGLMSDLVSKAGRRGELPDVEDDDILELFLPELALDVALSESISFDSVIIDEAQDLLRDTYLDFLEALVGGDFRTGSWRVFLDPNQNIFRGMAANELLRFTDPVPVQWPLTINCRNTAPIATRVALLSGVPLAETLATDGPQVRVQFYESPEQQISLVSTALTELQGGQIHPSQVVVLSAKSYERSVLKNIPMAVNDLSAGGDFEKPGLRFSTVKSFKGLEADAIVLTDVDDLGSGEGLSSVYVGASRARVVLYVFVDKSEHDAYENLAKEFGSQLMTANS